MSQGWQTERNLAKSVCLSACKTYRSFCFPNYFCPLSPLNSLNNSNPVRSYQAKIFSVNGLSPFSMAQVDYLQISQGVYQNKGYISVLDLPALDSRLLIAILSDLLEMSLLYYELEETLMRTIEPLKVTTDPKNRPTNHKM